VRVVVAYTRLHPAVRDALDRDGVRVEYRDTLGPHGYWQLLNDLWGDGEGFVLLEQDKIPVAGALDRLRSCRELWCAYPVPIRDGGDRCADFPTLACTKFAGELVQATPELPSEIGAVDVGYGLKDWHRLDALVAGYLYHRGFDVHWHERGMVEHRHV